MTKIEINGKGKQPQPLNFGYDGENNETLGATSQYLTRGGKPWFPVMGEFHFSRFLPQFWREEIEKMKAGGIQIAATYVFWIHHEEREGEWDFSGQRDLRRFLEICRECSLPVLLRIGPWSHGECRNGGFPDWLLKKEIQTRTNQKEYLLLVEKLFSRIFDQTDGMLWKQGGPVIGVQIENEYGHCGGLTGEAGREHMMTLKQMAVDIGFETPYYTATGWGGGIVPDGEMLPVLGAYCDAPWEQHLNPMPLNANYIFSHCKDDGNIGTDLQMAREKEFTYDVEKYPFFTAELGGGMQVTSHRRPIAGKKDTCAMALCKLGSGANLLGYYMYHGGTNPIGKDSTLQESRETGYLNDLPVFSYDFQAPVGEYGRIHEVFYHLRPLHLFLEEFGQNMAGTETVIPPWNADRPEDLESLRMAVRHNYDDNSGFLFVNAYQRHARVREYQGIQVRIETEQGCVRFPKMDIADGDYGFYPYGMKMGDAYLESANAQLLCRLGEKLVFFSDTDPDFRFSGDPDLLLTISRKQAEHAFKIGDKLYIAEGGCICQGESHPYLLTSESEGEILCLPEEKRISYSCAEASCRAEITDSSDKGEYKEYTIRLAYEMRKNAENFWLSLDFEGDRAELYLDGRMAGDWFYTGLAWEIGLKYFDCPETVMVRIYPVKKDVYLESRPKQKCALSSAWTETEYKILLEELCWIGQKNIKRL